MDENLIFLELLLFGDWLRENEEDSIYPSYINDKMISSYLSDRPVFAQKQKEKYPNLYADIEI